MRSAFLQLIIEQFMILKDSGLQRTHITDFAGSPHPPPHQPSFGPHTIPYLLFLIELNLGSA